jgi:putative transposase
MLDSISDKDWEIAQKRFSIIEPIITADREGKGVANRTEWIKTIAKENNVGYVSIYRWLNDYYVTGMISSLIPLEKKGGKGKSRLNHSLDLIINETIKDFYLTSHSKSQIKTVEEVIIRCRNAGLEPPHENTL